MIILIDLDGVTAKLMPKWLAAYNKKYNDILSCDKIETYDIEKHITKCSENEFISLLENPGFFSDLIVFSNAVEVTIRLQSAGHILYFVTATPYDAPTAGFDKLNWVQKHFPHIGRERVIQTHHKFMINGDILFDDNPKNLSLFDGITVAMDYLYNKNCNVDYRICSWLEFEKIIAKLTDFKNQEMIKNENSI